MKDLTPDDLFKTWAFQDEFSEIALKMIEAGIELGVKSAGIELMKAQIANNYGPLEVEQYEAAMTTASEVAKKTIRERLDNVRKS